MREVLDFTLFTLLKGRITGTFPNISTGPHGTSPPIGSKQRCFLDHPVDHRPLKTLLTTTCALHMACWATVPQPYSTTFLSSSLFRLAYLM